jgi:glyoxylase-like metal-dependent hydrolase (beta-lactamase superfamily II)
MCRLIRFLLVSLYLSLCVHVHAQQEGLKLKVITSSEGSLYANFTLIMGEKDMVLVDAPFTMSDAHRLVADVLETGLNLKYIYVTHDHPDHFFSMEVLTQAFPNAQVISAQQVVDDIWASIPKKVLRWGPMLGPNGPRYPTAPTPLTTNSFSLEGHEIQVLGPMQGDHHHATALWIPSLEALIAGDLVFQDIHLWLGESLAPQYEAWEEALDSMSSLDPKIVVAGHKVPGTADDASALAFTKEYLHEFSLMAAESDTSEELIAAVRKRFPEVQDVLNDFILPNSAQVAVGEVLPWEE